MSVSMVDSFQIIDEELKKLKIQFAIMKADLMQRWHEYGLSNDELINFKDEFNKFINHARPLFTPMREINMLL